MKHIIILISGGGSNMAAIVQAAQQQHWERRYAARVSAVISNKPHAEGLAVAKTHGIHTEVVDHKAYASRQDFDAALVQAIDRCAGLEHAPFVVLAGFMRILTPGFVTHYAGRLVNIHPSLLPAFTGLDTHRRAIEAGCQFAGATVHHVTADLDHGPILAQAVVPILPGDSPTVLAARVLSQEHRIYPLAIANLLSK